jgi:uncharacterized damage-inducible protein DinB
MPQILIKDIIRQLTEIQDGSLWFDQCFKEKLSLLTETEAFTRPIPQVHSVAEHISHILAWREECLLRFRGERTDLMNSPEDWKNNDALRETSWEKIKTQFYASTEALIKALENKDDSYLEIKFAEETYNNHYLIEGIIQHDIYHLGQIGITIKLMNQL